MKLKLLTPKKTRHWAVGEMTADLDQIKKHCGLMGYSISEDAAAEIWDAVSSERCAGWLNVPDDPGKTVEMVLAHAEAYDVADLLHYGLIDFIKERL